jgi:hypothetical protein
VANEQMESIYFPSFLPSIVGMFRHDKLWTTQCEGHCGTSWLIDKLIFPISFWCDHLGCLGSEVELSFGLVLVG